MAPHYKKEITTPGGEALFAYSTFSLPNALRNLKAISRPRSSQEIERSHARGQFLTQRSAQAAAVAAADRSPASSGLDV
jgi:hypothetical protein